MEAERSRLQADNKGMQTRIDNMTRELEEQSTEKQILTHQVKDAAKRQGNTEAVLSDVNAKIDQLSNTMQGFHAKHHRQLHTIFSSLQRLQPHDTSL